MRANVFFASMLMVAASSPLAMAQARKNQATPMPAAKVPTLIQANRLPHKIIYPGDIFYPAVLGKSGVQGEVGLELAFSSDGKLQTSKITKSSKSIELDKNALALVNNEVWKLPENTWKDSRGIYSLNVIFLKDSILNINKKTCADFNIDLKYFQLVRPGGDYRDLGAFELIAGMFTVQLMKNRGADGTMKYVQSAQAINRETILACAARPTELFVKTYARSASHQGVKF